MSFASKIDVGTSVLGSDQLKASPVASALCKVAPVEKEPSCQPAKHLPTLHFAKTSSYFASHRFDKCPASCMCSTFVLKSFSNKLAKLRRCVSRVHFENTVEKKRWKKNRFLITPIKCQRQVDGFGRR